ncbi:MAG: tyrosine-type recombinase/integrase [Blastocatellia bacterium]|nr:tyrosine-type recombinase/integrase [Blastocatellia bacterium]
MPVNSGDFSIAFQFGEVLWCGTCDNAAKMPHFNDGMNDPKPNPEKAEIIAFEAHEVLPAVPVSVTQMVMERLRDFLRKSNSEATRRTYRVSIGQFQEFLQRRGKSLTQAEPGDVLAFRDFLLSGAKPMKSSSVTLRLAAIRSFYGYLQLAQLITLNPADTRLVTPPPVPESSSTNALSAKQVLALLASPNRKTASGARDYVILLMMARMALRAAEVCSIRTRDIIKISAKDVKGRSINWVVNVRVKGGRERKLPIPDDVKTAIDHYLRLDADARRTMKGNGPEAALIQRSGMGRTLGGQPITTRALWNIVKKYGDYLGIKRIHPHSFRHTAITRALDMGLSYRDVQMMSGHKSIMTVQKYDANRDDMARNAINELSYEEENGT